MTENPKIVLLEDDNGVRRSLQMLLQGRGFSVKAYASAASLLSDPRPADIDCLVADYRLGSSDGLAVLQTLRASGWEGPAILVTAFGSEDVRSRARNAGFSEVLEKPLRDHVLVAALRRLAPSPSVEIDLLASPGLPRTK